MRYVLDVMHCEKNLADSLLRMLFGEIDTPFLRMDLENWRIRRNLAEVNWGLRKVIHVGRTVRVVNTAQTHNSGNSTSLKDAKSLLQQPPLEA